jgi:hypothetical protein
MKPMRAIGERPPVLAGDIMIWLVRKRNGTPTLEILA